MAQAREIEDTGLSVVFEPSGTVPVVDIVFIHGLQGHPFNTWATKRKIVKTTSKDSNKSPNDALNSAGTPRRSLRPLFGRFKTHRKKTTEPDTHAPSVCDTEIVDESGLEIHPRALDDGVDAVSIEAEISKAGNHDSREETVALKSPDEWIFWPGDLLPEKCPDARILTWGYDSMVTKIGSFGGRTNKNSIFSHAKDLLFSLKRQRPLGRRTILVAHSLGGIVVKEMLSIAEVSKNHAVKDILRSIAGVVFLGTPHRGSPDMARLGDTVRGAASFILRIDTSASAIKALGLQSDALERSQDAFARIWSSYDFKVKTFQEALPLTGLNIGLLNQKVVPDFSSILGDPREAAETIQANHMDMCRFKSRDDPNYRKVSDELQGMYKDVFFVATGASSKGRHRKAVEGDAVDLQPDGNATALASLAFPEMYRRKAAIGLPTENTCDWLLNHAVFRSWLDRTRVEKSQGFLCIKGKPGAGKSTILKTISAKVASEGKAQGFSVVTYFFNAKGTELERSRLGLLRSLAYQIVSIDKSFLARLATTYQESIHQVTSSGEGSKAGMEWQVPELEEILDSIFRAGTTSRIVIFVDALDECAEADATSVVSFLRQLTRSALTSHSALDICLSTRHFPSVTLRDSPSIIVEHYNQQDMNTFLQSKLAATELPLNGEWLRLKKSIIDKSNGVFLWVVLVADSLLKHWETGKSMAFLRNHLDKVPDKLEELYTSLLSNDHEDRSTALKLFQWAVFALQPLRLREWHHILAFIRPEGPPSSLSQWRSSEHYTENDDQLERQIRSISKGLIEVVSIPEIPVPPGGERYSGDCDSADACAGSLDPHQGETRTVQVVHESVRQFFVEGNGFAVIDRAHEHHAGEGHLLIVETCLNYIMIKELDGYIQALEEAQTALHRQIIERHRKLRRGTRGSSSVQSFDSAGSGSIGSKGSQHSRGSLESRGSFKRRPSPQRLSRALLSLENGHIHSTDASNYIISKFLEQSRPAEDLDLYSHHSMSSAHRSQRSGNTGATAATRVLEDFPALLHYSTNMVFAHARLAESLGSTDSDLIQATLRHPPAVWKRFQLLLNDYPTVEEFFAHCVEQACPLLWLDCIFDIGETANSLFNKYAARHDPDAAKSTIVFLDIRKHLRDKRLHHRKTLLHQILADINTTSEPTDFGPWRAQIETLLNEHRISINEVRHYLDTPDPTGLPPLLKACELGFHSAALELLQLGSDPHLGKQGDPDMTPVHFVTESIRELRDFGKRWNAILVLKKLLELGVYVSLLTLMDLKMTRDIHFHQPPDLDLLKLLEQRGVALETTSGEDYWTVEALYDYLYEYLKLAGDVSPADRKYVIQTAISHGADIDFAPARAPHETLLHFAATSLITGNYQHLESLLATLVAAGAAIPPVILWHVAAAGRFDDPQDEALLLVRTEAARFFLGHGVEVNTSYNTAAETALHYAAVGHNYHMVKLLLSRGGDARAVNNKGSTPLHYACGAGHGFGTYCSSEGRKECVLALIRGGADVSARDNRGSAPVDFLVGQDSELLEILGSGVQAKRENR